MNILNNLLELSGGLKQIIDPVLNHLGISYFCYVRRYKNSRHVSICNNMDWQQHFYKNELHLSDTYEYMHPIENYKASKLLWIAGDKNTKVSREISNFNIGNGMTIIETKPDYIEFYHFGSDMANVEINNFYINNNDFFIKFIFYFIDKTYEIFKESNLRKNSISLSEPTRLKMKMDFSIIDIDTEISRIFLQDDIYISQREYECLKWLSKGKSAEETGVLLDISKRTVESHLDSLKLKMDCSKNTQLIAKSFLKKILLPE